MGTAHAASTIVIIGVVGKAASIGAVGLAFAVGYVSDNRPQSIIDIHLIGTFGAIDRQCALRCFSGFGQCIHCSKLDRVVH